MENKVLATIGDIKLTSEDLEFMKRSMDPRILQQFAGEQGEFYLIQELINQKLIAMDAKESNMMESEDFKKEFEAMKDNFIYQYAIKHIIENVEVTDEEVEKFYEENKQSFAESVKIRASHILVETEEKAKQIFDKIKNGGDFGKLAKENSTCPSKENDGDLGYFGKGQMVKEFEDAAYKLAVGEVSEPVKTQFGYHIIKLIDRKDLPKKEFSEVKEHLKQSLLAQKRQNAYVKKVNELREKYNVK